LLFLVSYLLYVLLVMAPAQRLVIQPLIRLFPSRRPRMLRPGVRLQAGVVLAFARALAGMRVVVEGKIPPTSCIVVMNHQSVLDVPLGAFQVPGPYPLIPTRASYARSIPGISTLLRMMGCPLLSQGRSATRAELKSLLDAAEQVARGDQSFLTFPEGHRSSSGEILPFMTPGLSLIFKRARERPVYLVVADGLHHLRAFKEIATQSAGTRVRVTIAGPYTIPAEDYQLAGFIESLRLRMVETLGRMRTDSSGMQALAARSV
jgi:1-acyl-sn-glycerol-3-phosphate acyltransferase